MTIKNTSVVDTTLKYIVKSTGIKDEDGETLVDASKLKEATNESLVSLIECFYLIEGSGTVTIKAGSETSNLTLTGKGKYGLRPDQLKFGNDGIITLSTDSSVDSYLMVTEFRRNED
jgi:hypothetical protein